MGVINIVKKYPEVFGKVEETIDEEDAWRMIASVQCHGGRIERNTFLLYHQFIAVYNLFHLGLRDEAVEMALEVLRIAISRQFYEIAQQLCKFLVDDAFLMDDINSVHKYNELYKKYTEIIELEYQAKLIYGELLHNHNRGIETNEIEVIRSLSQLEEKLPLDNPIYHYYYHSCQIILASENEYMKSGSKMLLIILKTCTIIMIHICVIL